MNEMEEECVHGRSLTLTCRKCDAGAKVKTVCEECLGRVTLTTVDANGVLIGDECPKCGYYVTRYMPGQEPK